MIKTALIAWLTIAMVILAYPYALEWQLYSLHPLGMALFAWSSGTAAIVLSFPTKPTPSTAANKTANAHTSRVKTHALLGFVAFVSVAIGFAAIYANKIRQNKLHFQSYHGISGLVLFTLVIAVSTLGGALHYFPVAVFGSLLHSKRYIFLKRYAGYAALTLSLYTFSLGLLMHSTEERISSTLRLFIFSSVLTTLVSTTWNFLVGQNQIKPASQRTK
ncbi:hypothetical protein HK100_012044 [Physocladia obscura]|uniref:Cytochrome b561 domain-containing protein n=1 Tax=Physocladia obscura TaxID=109957 RepID=A0AAD5XDL2_9FUNG|nr:hypothetical protein HK100_012044 [Physocladia obscura]